MYCMVKIIAELLIFFYLDEIFSDNNNVME